MVFRGDWAGTLLVGTAEVWGVGSGIIFCFAPTFDRGKDGEGGQSFQHLQTGGRVYGGSRGSQCNVSDAARSVGVVRAQRSDGKALGTRWQGFGHKMEEAV